MDIANRVLLVVVFALTCTVALAAERPHIVLVMSDDQGWGQVGYYDHPVLKTPHLNAMAENGLRFDRFYAAGPVCSPTRASVLTGRTHNRTGVPTHGHALRRQERTIAAALKKVGYATGHFGKWHLNGVRGPGVPVLKEDAHHPGHFGFEHWLTVTNYFDVDPLMSRMGEFVAFEGDSSDIIVDEALKFIEMNAKDRPTFSVIWYGSPHSPFIALEKDQVDGEESRSANHHGEIVAIDRSVGTLRAGLRKLGIADNTIVWYCSDNGGLKGVGHDSVGGLRGHKGSVYEGGIRVPGIIEWPAKIEPRVTAYPASTMDIFPTVVDLLDLPRDAMLDLVDGVSLAPLFDKEIGPREKPIPFRFTRWAALIDNDLKIVVPAVGKDDYELYDLKADHAESKNIIKERPEDAKRMITAVEAAIASIARSDTGADYPEGKVTRDGPHGRFWHLMPEYEPHFDEFRKYPRYKSRLDSKLGETKKKKTKKK